MKKILCILMVATAVSLTLTSCKQEAKEGNILISDKSCDFSFQCPDTWKISHTDGMLSAFNPNDISKANVTANSFYHNLNEETSSKDYWETYKKQFDDTFSQMEIVKTNHNATLAGLPATHAFYNVTLGANDYVCETILCVYADKVYVITMTQGAKDDTNKDFYNNHTDEFEKIAKTFRIG